MGDFFKEYASYLVQRFGGEMVSAETDKDHMHLLVSLPPDIAPSTVVAILKTQLSKEARVRFKDDVKKYLWYDTIPFWTPSYFIATTGTVSLEKVKEYISGQRTEEHKRKYERTGKYSKKKKPVTKEPQA